MQPTTIFSWGYWGWGNATRELVASVDATEAARGFAPPVFVDIRISRSVRAPGFRDAAFERLLGSGRYRWMRSLGNRAVQTHEGPPIQIADPAGAADLLDLALELSHQERRLLYFCSCEFARSDEGAECHRVEAGRLTLAEARRRGAPVTLVEWPGGEPSSISLGVPQQNFRAVQRGRASIPLKGTTLADSPHGFAVGSIATLWHADESLQVVTGPARFANGGWYLPVMRAFPADEASRERPDKWASKYRARRGYLPVEVASATRHLRGGSNLFPACVYTILHLEKLDRMAQDGGRGTATEGRAWTSGRRLLEQARAAGQRLAVVFADAADCSRLHYWAVLTSIEVTVDGTRYSFEGLRPTPGGHTPQDLVLLESGKHIAHQFIRPYALCRTPSFIGLARPSA